MSTIKRQEAFVLNLIGACAFAANNIRNIVDREQSEDILGKKPFNLSLKKQTVDDKLFKSFYNHNTNDHLWAMRGAVQQIRNNIFHYKSDSIDTVFNISKFETDQSSGQQYSDSIFKNILENEINRIPHLIAEQLKSGGILSYYNLNDIKNLLNECKFSLCRSSLPFTPGFKKVANGGRGYQYSSMDDKNKKYNLELEYYIDKNTDKNKEQQYQANYFLLKLLYNNMFLPYFTDQNNIVAFKKAVDFVRDVNKKFAADKSDKSAFNDVREMNERDTISGYMSYVQSQFIQEQNKKGTKNSDKRINFENFLLQIFIKGFDNCLKSKEIGFIKSPEFQFEIGITDTDKATKLNEFENNIATTYKFPSSININSDIDSHIAFFTFCKLLNASHLSNLRNELIKFRQTGQFEFHHIIEIIELCLLSVDKSPIAWNELYRDKSAWETHVKKFVEDGADISKWGDLFLQKDNSTPIVHANISLCVKYGTEQLLEHIVAKHKLKKSDYDEWIEVGKSIAEDTRKRDELHVEWVEAKRKDDKERENEKRTNAKNFISENAKTYISLCNKIDAYNWLDNKMHFVHLNKLHNLIIDILSRMVGFVSLWDRDFQILDARRTSDKFQLKRVISLDEKTLPGSDSAKDKDISKIKEIRNKAIIKRDNSDIYESDRDSLKTWLDAKREEYKKVFFKNKTNLFVSRNKIAHFEYLYKNDKKYLLIKLINDLRDMFNYDRKLKNAVTKAIIDLFDKNGMELKLTKDKHEIKLDEIKPKKIYHLGSTEITTNHVDTEFCNICEELF